MESPGPPPRSFGILGLRLLFIAGTAGLILASQWAIEADADRLLAARPELRAAAQRGTGFLWEARRALAALSWVKAQDYFHRGFTVADFIRPEDIKAFEEHEQEDLGEFRNQVMENAQPQREAPTSMLPPASMLPPDSPPSTLTSSIPSIPSTKSTHAAPAPEHARKQAHTAAHEELHEALERRFGHDTHPLMTTSLLRPYKLEHEHGVSSVPMMLPWYWLTTALDPHFTRAYANGAWWLAFVRKDVDRAKEYLRSGLRHNPGDPDILMALGEIAMRLENNLDEAIRDFRQAVHGPHAAPTGSETQENAWRYLIFALERAGHKQDACQEARQALLIYPNHAGFPEVAKRNCP